VRLHVYFIKVLHNYSGFKREGALESDSRKNWDRLVDLDYRSFIIDLLYSSIVSMFSPDYTLPTLSIHFDWAFLQRNSRICVRDTLQSADGDRHSFSDKNPCRY